MRTSVIELEQGDTELGDVDADFDDELSVLDLLKHEIADIGAVDLHPDGCDNYERVPLIVRHHARTQQLVPSVWVDEDQASADVTHLPARVPKPPPAPPTPPSGVSGYQLTMLVPAPVVTPSLHMSPRLCDCLPGATGVPGWRRARVHGDKVMIRVADENMWTDDQRTFLKEIARDDEVIVYTKTA